MRVWRTSTVRWRFGPCCSDLPLRVTLVMAPYCCPTLWGLLPSTCAPFCFWFPFIFYGSMRDSPLPRGMFRQEIR
jgi:hypothetical protein